MIPPSHGKTVPPSVQPMVQPRRWTTADLATRSHQLAQYERLAATLKGRRLAPGTRLITTSKNKDKTASAGSSHPHFPPRTGVTTGTRGADKEAVTLLQPSHRLEEPSRTETDGLGIR